MAVNCVLTNQFNLTEEEAKELYLPIEDPGFSGKITGDYYRLTAAPGSGTGVEINCATFQGDTNPVIAFNIYNDPSDPYPYPNAPSILRNIYTPTYDTDAANKLYVDSVVEELMPVQDPGFLGMLWSQGENGDTFETMTEYDSGDGNKTSYLSIHREGAAVDIGVSKREAVAEYNYELVDSPYLVLSSTDDGGYVEAQASKYGASISMQSPGADYGGQKGPSQVILQTVQGNGNYSEIPAASMYCTSVFKDGLRREGTLYFFPTINGQVRVNGIATPEKPKDSVNKEYVDNKIQFGVQAPSELEDGVVFLVYE